MKSISTTQNKNTRHYQYQLPLQNVQLLDPYYQIQSVDLLTFSPNRSLGSIDYNLSSIDYKNAPPPVALLTGDSPSRLRFMKSSTMR